MPTNANVNAVCGMRLGPQFAGVWEDGGLTDFATNHRVCLVGWLFLRPTGGVGWMVDCFCNQPEGLLGWLADFAILRGLGASRRLPARWPTAPASQRAVFRLS